MKELIVKEIPVDLSAFHPKGPNEILPKHEFSMGLIAPKGSGKTTLLVNLLMYYKHYFTLLLFFLQQLKMMISGHMLKSSHYLLKTLLLKSF